LSYSGIDEIPLSHFTDLKNALGPDKVNKFLLNENGLKLFVGKCSFKIQCKKIPASSLAAGLV
jgi:hypothetical protein